MLANRCCIRFVWFKTARECRGVCAHFGAALNTTMTTNWHESCTVAANVAASKREVHDAANSGTGVFVLRDAHRPKKDCRARVRVFVDECIELRHGEAGIVEQFLVGEIGEVRDNVVPMVRVLCDKCVIDRISFNQSLECSVSKSDVTTRTNRHMQIAHLCAEQC